MSEAYLKIDNLQKFYPVRGGGSLFGSNKNRKLVKAVNGVSLSLSQGEVLGLIGESGCGKSTIGRLLMRLEDPTGGDVFIGGESTGQMLRHNRKAFYRSAQIVFQNPFDTFTPRDTIEKIMVRPLRNHGIGASHRERYELCLQALESGGLRPAEDIIRRYPHELSGGQLQRISILRSMMLNPAFIVADEPVSMLDVSVRADIINMLLELSSKQNTTVVFISHDIALTRHISDNIAVMYLGRIVEYGPSDVIIRDPRHPYTQALISNCTSIDLDDKSTIIKIVGEPPTPINPGPGCFFADRCPNASARCAQAYPDTTELGAGHTAACWNL